MNTYSSNKRHAEEATSEPLSHLTASQATKEALSAAARKGGAIMIRGRELRTLGSLSEEHSSPSLEGMLMQVSEQATRRAQILNYQKAGLTPYEIIKAVWHVEDTQSPAYRTAYEEYKEVMHTHGYKHH